MLRGNPFRIGLVLLVALPLAGCAGNGSALADIEEEVRVGVQDQLRKAADGGTVEVPEVVCVKDGNEATCVAEVGGDRVVGEMSVAVKFGEDGRFIWESDPKTLEIAPELRRELSEARDRAVWLALRERGETEDGPSYNEVVEEMNDVMVEGCVEEGADKAFCLKALKALER